jgi:hypothetical protein
VTEVAALVLRLQARIASEVAEQALAAEIEATLARLRLLYRDNPRLFDTKTVAALRRARDLGEGLRLFRDVTARRGEISDALDYERACGEMGTLLVLFEGLPVRARVLREWEALRDLRPMVGILDPREPRQRDLLGDAM